MTWSLEWTDALGRHHFKLFKSLVSINAYCSYLEREGAGDFFTSAV